MKMKMKVFFGILFSFALMLGLVPGMTKTAWADDGVWVNNVHANVTNSGTGWSYESSTNTLTLNGYNFTGVGDAPPSDSTVIQNYQDSDTFTIVLQGSNTIEQGYSETSKTWWGIYSKSDLVITGEGTLNISTTAGKRGAPIYCEKDVTIVGNCTVTATSGAVSEGPQGHGIGGDGTTTLTIGENAKVTLQGPNGAANYSVKNAAPGTGWTDTAGTEGQAPIEISTSGQNLTSYRKIQFPADCASVTTSDETTNNYGSFTDALNDWANGSTLTLLKDVTISNSINVADTRTLDLNGYGITYNGGSGSVFSVGNGGNLTINDSRPNDTTHKYTAASSSGPGTLSNSGPYSFTGGYITGGKGTYNGNWCFGGCVYINGGTLNLVSGTMVGNKVSQGNNEDGGTVAIHGGGTFNMSGGAIVSGYSTNGTGGIMVGHHKDSTGTFNMTGGSILYNYGVNAGSAVRLTGGNNQVAVISGGTIKGNTAGGSGCAVGVENQTNLTLTGGTIEYNSDNNTNNSGGGIYVGGTGTLLLSGNPIVSNNTSNGKMANLNLGSKIASINGQLTEGANIGVSTTTAPSESSDVLIATGAVADDIKYIHYDYPKKAGVVFCDGAKDWQYVDDQIVEVAGCHHGTHTSGNVYLITALDKKIVYNGNAQNREIQGEPPATQNCAIGDSVTAADKGTLAIAGLKFLGWSKNPDAKVAQYRQGDTITLTSDMLDENDNSKATFYAVWVTQIIPTIKNNGYPWGSDMSSVGFTLHTGVEEDIEGITYQWQSKSDGTSTFESISSATSATYTPGSSPADGTWYRCMINGNPTEAVQVIKPEYKDEYWEVSDLYGRIWTSPYYDTSHDWHYSWYISNGTMAYTVDTTNAKFDIVGAYTKDSNTYMLQTAFGGNGWQMYSSAASHPGATDCYSASHASLDSVKFAFSGNNPNELLIEADLVDGQQSFSFGTDTQLGNYETSGGYSDYAALIATTNDDNILKQIAMIGAASTTDETAPAFVIRSKEKDNVPFYYLGGYYERQPFGYNSNDPSGYGQNCERSRIKATGLGEVTGITKILEYDTGMTMSWYDIPAGGSVKFGFSVGSAGDIGAVESAVNYGMEVLEGLEPGTEYTITCGGVEYKFTSTTEGTIALSGTDESEAPKTYNFIGKSISIQAENKTPQNMTIAARPTGVIPVNVDDSIAQKPIEIRESDYAVTNNSITMNFDVTDNSNTARQKRTQEYRIYASNGAEIEGCGWVKPGANGKLTFSGLTSGTTYLVKARIPATETAPCSDPVSVNRSKVKTAANITVTTPAANSDITTATLDGSDKEGATVNYSTALDEIYADEVPTFTAGGKYTVYYRVVKEGSQPLYGSYDKTVNCTVTLDAKGGTLAGGVNSSYSVNYDNTINNGIALADPSNGSLKFAGWYEDEAYTKLWSITDNKITSDMTLYARWVESLSNFGFNDEDIATFMKLQLFKGNVPVSEEKTISNGTFSQFTNIPDGEYQMVITTNAATGNKVISLLVKVENIGGTVKVSGTATKPEKTINSMVKVEDGAPNVVVGQLDAEAAVKTGGGDCEYWDAQYDVVKKNDDGSDKNIKTSVNITLQVKNEEDLSVLNISDAEAQKGFTKEEQDLRNAQSGLKIIAGGQELSFMDFSIIKEVTQTETVNNSSKTVSLGSKNIPETNKVLEIVVPFDTSQENICVYRSHNGSSETFTKLDNRPTDPDQYTDGTYFVGDGFVVIYANKFSTYAIGYGTKSSQGGGGGTPTTSYTPIITKPEHGNTTVSPESIQPGQNAVVTVTPEEGYEVETVTVTDKDGNTVPVTKNADGTFTFTQPSTGSVTIEAVLRLKGGVAVRFDLNGKTGTAPDAQTFAKGGKAVRPDNPTAKGYKFTGWFTDKECKNAYDFDTPVNEDLILYAGWNLDDDFGIYFVELFDDPYEGVHYNSGLDRYEIVYTGSAITPLIKVTSKADGVLKEGIDYTVTYSNNKNVSKPGKPALIKINGKGIYKDKKVLELYILPADLEEAVTKDLLVGTDEIKVQDGKKLSPVFVYCGYKLGTRDFDLNNKEVIKKDTTVTVTGKGNFKGELKDVPVKVISKEEVKNGAIKVKLKANSHTYNGEAHELTVAAGDVAGELTVTAGTSKTLLVKGTDFVVHYSKNVNAGKAAFTVTGIGSYNGTYVGSFTIAPDKATEITTALTKKDEPVYHSVRGAMPGITVTASRTVKGSEMPVEEVLKEGKDYKITYSSNKKIGNGAYTVKFLGNYKGHKDVKGSFPIVPAPIDTAKVDAAQLIYKKPGRYLSKPFVSVEDVQLKTSDYTFKYYVGDVKDVKDGSAKELTSKDRFSLPDDKDSRTITIAVTGKGNYTGTAYGTYEVIRLKTDLTDLTKAKIVAKEKNKRGKDVNVSKQEYTGYAIEPEIRVMVKVNKVWTDLDPSLYTVSYINNRNKGRATILVNGNDTDTIGSKSVGFTITKMRMNLFNLLTGK